jgi:hypothetical protein
VTGIESGTIDGLRPGGLAGADGDQWLRTLLGAVLGSSEELARAREDGVVSEEYAKSLAERFAAADVTVEDVYVLCVLYGFSLSAVLPVAPLVGDAGRDSEAASL